MRHRFALGSIALGSIALAAACGITARSDEFRCQVPTDCADGRFCLDGWCVSGPGDAAADGSAGSQDGTAADAPSCPAVCDRCQRDTCIIECEGSGACAGPVVCPPGIPCEVRCEGANACGGGIDCSAASACNILCRQTGACSGMITCGQGRCDVECDGSGSCAGGIDCSQACRCDTDCDGIGSCAMDPSCPFDECVNASGECTGTGLGCNGCS